MTLARLTEFERGQWLVHRKSKKLWRVEAMSDDAVTLARFPLTDERQMVRTPAQVFNGFRAAYSADWKREGGENVRSETP